MPLIKEIGLGALLKRDLKDILEPFEECGEQLEVSAASHNDKYTVGRPMRSSVENCDDTGVSSTLEGTLYEQNQLGRLPPSTRQH